MSSGLAPSWRAARSFVLGTILLGAMTVASMEPRLAAAQAIAVPSTPHLAGHDPVRQASAALMQWRQDWENRDFERFAAHYADSFQSTGLDRVAYLERKRAIFEKRPWQRVRINEVLWIAQHGTPDVLSVRFVQEYDSPQGNDRSRKEQRWIRNNNNQRWQLAGETELVLTETEASRTRPKSGAGAFGK